MPDTAHRAAAYGRSPDATAEGLPRGSQRQNTAAPARPSIPMAATAAPSDTSAATADRITGPKLLPRSATSRHMPRNSVRPVLGAESAPSVMTMPEPMPLPMPSIIDITTNPTTPVVNDVPIRAMPISKVQGNATQSRPRLSISVPAG